MSNLSARCPKCGSISLLIPRVITGGGANVCKCGEVVSDDHTCSDISAEELLDRVDYLEDSLRTIKLLLREVFAKTDSHKVKQCLDVIIETETQWE